MKEKWRRGGAPEGGVASVAILGAKCAILGAPEGRVASVAPERLLRQLALLGDLRSAGLTSPGGAVANSISGPIRFYFGPDSRLFLGQPMSNFGPSGHSVWAVDANPRSANSGGPQSSAPLMAGGVAGCQVAFPDGRRYTTKQRTLVRVVPK